MRTYLRYLAAKRSVDDRALNRHVLEALRAELARAGPERVLEVGAGTGSMLERMIDWDLLRQVDYTAVDADGAALAEARSSLPDWARQRGWSCARGSGEDLTVAGDGRAITFRTVCEDLLELERPGEFDLLVASAVLDLVDLGAALPRLLRCLTAGGLFWFTINFDGETIFQPELDPELDAQIVDLYHRTMGDSQTGRRLFTHLPRAGAEILAAGSSDWVVHAVRGRYPEREDAFLHHILDTVAGALREHPELDADRFREWLETRHRQVESGELVFIAHQIDFLGRARGHAPSPDQRLTAAERKGEGAQE